MVYIVVLNWNGWRDTVACLESLMSLDYASYKIVICDNDSSDDSVDQLLAWYKNNKTNFEYLQGADFSFLEKDQITNYHSLSDKGLYLLQTGKNLGYAGGNNVGLKFALQQEDMEFAWVLNNDTEVEARSLEPLLDKCKSGPNVGICGSKLVYFDNRDKVQAVGGHFNPWICYSKHIAHMFDSGTVISNNIIDEINYVVGASTLVSRIFLEDVGLLSEDYFLYYEEIDWAIRAKRCGYNLAVALDSIVYHKEGAATKKISKFSEYCFLSNRLKLYKKFFWWLLPIAWSSLFVSLLKRLLKGDLSSARLVFLVLLGKKLKNV